MRNHYEKPLWESIIRNHQLVCWDLSVLVAMCYRIVASTAGVAVIWPTFPHSWLLIIHVQTQHRLTGYDGLLFNESLSDNVILILLYSQTSWHRVYLFHLFLWCPCFYRQCVWIKQLHCNVSFIYIYTKTGNIVWQRLLQRLAMSLM